MENRIIGLDGKILGGGDNGGRKLSFKQKDDNMRSEIQMKQVNKARDILHKRMMEEIAKIVPAWRQRLCAKVFPVWLTKFLMALLPAFPPQSLMMWAINPTSKIHPAYRMVLLLPLVIPGSIIRVCIGAPLRWLQNRIYLYGIKTDLKPITEFVNELVIIQRGGETKRFTQDWRYGDIRLKEVEKVNG